METERKTKEDEARINLDKAKMVQGQKIRQTKTTTK